MRLLLFLPLVVWVNAEADPQQYERAEDPYLYGKTDSRVQGISQPIHRIPKPIPNPIEINHPEAEDTTIVPESSTQEDPSIRPIIRPSNDYQRPQYEVRPARPQYVPRPQYVTRPPLRPLEFQPVISSTLLPSSEIVESNLQKESEIKENDDVLISSSTLAPQTYPGNSYPNRSEFPRRPEFPRPSLVPRPIPRPVSIRPLYVETTTKVQEADIPDKSITDPDIELTTEIPVTPVEQHDSPDYSTATPILEPITEAELVDEHLSQSEDATLNPVEPLPIAQYPTDRPLPPNYYPTEKPIEQPIPNGYYPAGWPTPPSDRPIEHPNFNSYPAQKPIDRPYPISQYPINKPVVPPLPSTEYPVPVTYPADKPVDQPLVHDNYPVEINTQRPLISTPYPIDQGQHLITSEIPYPANVRPSYYPTDKPLDPGYFPSNWPENRPIPPGNYYPERPVGRPILRPAIHLDDHHLNPNLEPIHETSTLIPVTAVPTSKPFVPATERPTFVRPRPSYPSSGYLPSSEHPIHVNLAQQITTIKPYLPSYESSQYPTEAIGIIQDFSCAAGNGFYSVADECDTYIECRKSVAMKYVCPDGLNFNIQTAWPNNPCAYPSEVQCRGNYLSKPQPTSECPRQYGYFPLKDGECGRYLSCQDGRATIMSCPLGLVFSEVTSSCDWPENVPSCKPVVFQGFTCPDMPLESDGRPSDTILKYRYGVSCKQYVACQRGHPRLLSCDAGLAFDENSQTCIDADYVENCDHTAVLY